MTRLPVNDFTLLEPDIIELEPEDFNTINQTLDWATGESHRWSRYIQGLALAGFNQWIQEQSLGLPLNLDECTLLQPQYTNWLTAVSNLTIGDFQMCLIATESLSSGTVSVPRAVVEMSEFAAHLYVLVEVEEEEGIVIIQGLLRYDEWQRYYQLASPSPAQDWTYAVPLSLFESEPCRIGLYTRYLDPSAIALPQAVSYQMLVVASALDMSQALWQQLSWEHASHILTSPAELNQANGSAIQVRPVPTQETSNSLPNLPLQRLPLQGLRDIAQEASQVVVNAAQWLEAGLDELADSVGFFSHERIQLARGIRSALTIEDAIHNLRSDGVPIPPELNPVYRDIEIGDMDYRICLLPYANTTESADSEWSLLVLLGTQTADYLPEGLQLSINKDMELLESYTLEFEEVLVYSLADANFGELLRVSITAPNGDNFALPLLTFIYEGA